MGRVASGDNGRLAEIVFLALALLLAWAPLPLASNRPWSAALLVLAAGLLLAGWSAAALRRPALMRLAARRFAPAALLFLPALAWAYAQAAPVTPGGWHHPAWAWAARVLGQDLAGSVSADPAATLAGAMRLTAYGCIFFVSAQLCRSSGNARRLVRSVVVIGFCYAAYGLAVFLTGNATVLFDPKWAYLDDLTSTFVSRSAYGAYAGIGLLATLAMMLETLRERAASPGGGPASVTALVDSLPPVFYLLLLNCIVLGTAMLLSHSRGALAVTALGTVVMLAALAARLKGRRRPVLVAGALILAGGLALVETSGGVTLGRVLQLDEQGTGREAIHRLAGKAIAEAPLTGHGLDSFAQTFLRLRDASIPWSSPRFAKAHSTYLELAAELGLPAFVLLMAGIAIIVGTLAAGVLRRRRNAIYPCLALGVTALLGAHAAVDFSVQMPAVAATWCALLGAGFAQSWRSAPDRIRF